MGETIKRHTPLPGEFYQHFKGKLYQICHLAEHSETGEQLVIYQALYDDYRIYARPLTQFMSEVDHTKYPEAAAQYRFTQVAFSSVQKNSSGETDPDQATEMSSAKPLPVSEELLSEEKTPEKLFLMFLDAESSREKLEVLTLLKRNLNRRMADSLAASMDLVLPGNSIEEDVELMEDHIRTRAKFETRW